MGLVERILRGGEEGVLSKEMALVHISLRANGILGDVIKKQGSVEKLAALEKEAARTSFRMYSLITSGAVAPNLIDNMMTLVTREMDIVDAIFNLSRQLTRYTPRERKARDYLDDHIAEMNGLAQEAIRMLRDMHRADRISRAKRIRMKIKELESEGDAVKDAMLDHAYRSGNGDFRTFYHMIDAAYLADDVLDGCEDSSDILMDIMLSIIS